jgi:hypothetical protein
MFTTEQYVRITCDLGICKPDASRDRSRADNQTYPLSYLQHIEHRVQENLRPEA